MSKTNLIPYNKQILASWMTATLAESDEKKAEKQQFMEFFT